MSALFEAPAPSPSHRYLIALISRFRRIVNRSVARMLANRERQLRRFVQKKLDDREQDIGRHARTGTRTALFALSVVGALSPALSGAGEPAVRDHRGGRAQQVPRSHCDSRNHTHTPDGGCTTATGPATVRDHRSR